MLVFDPRYNHGLPVLRRMGIGHGLYMYSYVPPILRVTCATGCLRTTAGQAEALVWAGSVRAKIVTISLIDLRLGGFDTD